MKPEALFGGDLGLDCTCPRIQLPAQGTSGNCSIFNAWRYTAAAF